MQTQISQFLAADPRSFPSNENIIIGDRSSEGSFLLHYFLTLSQRQARPLVVVALAQSFHHYNSVAQKLGSNLISACNDSKTVVFIEGLKALGNIFDRSSSTDKFEPFCDLLNNGDSLSLLQHIKSSIDGLSQSESIDHSLGPVVIIDDLSVLLAAGVAQRDVILFYSGLQALLTSQDRKGSLITFSNVDINDEALEDLWSFMSHGSTLRFEVSALKSGFCKDVHGQLRVEWRDHTARPRHRLTRSTQFKLTDKTVELFASGMSSAVL